MKKYTVDYFIKKFSKIPKSEWTLDRYVDEAGRHCALGHCGVTLMNFNTPQADALRALLPDIVYINDTVYFKSKNQHPKTRVIAALKQLQSRKKEEKK